MINNIVKKSSIYIIYRKTNDRYKKYIYGWTNSKNVLKAFLDQRSKKKYEVYKRKTELDNIYEGRYNDIYIENMINFVYVRSVKNPNKKIMLFITAEELHEVEIMIQTYFRELCKISKLKGNTMNYLNMFNIFDKYYMDALELIGCIPSELSTLYSYEDPSDDPCDIEGISEIIDNCYDASMTYPGQLVDTKGIIPGQKSCLDIHNKIIYSLESFIMVLREYF